MSFDQRLPAADACVVADMLDRQASARPDKIFLVFEDGEQWSFAETRRRARAAAAGLAALGVVKGDHVLSWLPNGGQAILTWFSLNILGAVYVPINTSYRGGLLEHVVALSDATLMIGHAQLLPRLADIDRAGLSDIVVVGGSAPAIDGLTFHGAEALAPAGAECGETEVAPWDTQYIIFTSGTTGPSKAVLSSYVQAWTMGVEANRYMTADDRFLVNLPLFHVGGTIFVQTMLSLGGSCLVTDGFRTDSFWDDVRRHGVTGTCLVGAMTPFLLKLPPSDRDRAHPLRKAVTVPWNEDSLALAERYGIDMYTAFNMTEISSPIVSEANPAEIGTYEGRI